MSLTGIINIKIDGELLMTRDASIANITGFERTTQSGNVVHGATRKVVAPKIECTRSHDSSDIIERIAEREDLNASFICDSGVSYIIDPCWLVNSPGIEAEGAQKLTFEGKSARRVKT